MNTPLVVLAAAVALILGAVIGYAVSRRRERARRELEKQAGAHFHPRVVRALFNVSLGKLRRLLGPGLCTSLGPRGVAAWVFGLPLPTPALAAQVPVTHNGRTVVSARTVARAHRRGLHVYVWTVDEPEEMHRLLDLGVDGLMTDHPTRLREVLRARGQWHG